MRKRRKIIAGQNNTKQTLCKATAIKQNVKNCVHTHTHTEYSPVSIAFWLQEFKEQKYGRWDEK